MVLPLLILLQLLWLAPPSSSKNLSPSTLENDALGCNDVPYPFGFKDISPSTIPGFELTCEPREKGSVMFLPLGSTKLQVLNISVPDGYIRVLLEGVTWRCGRRPGEIRPTGQTMLDLEGTPFTFSDTRNKLTAIGCDVMAQLNVSVNHTTGCASFCLTPESVVDGSCSGVGCCQASIPKGLKSFVLELDSIRNLTNSMQLVRTGNLTHWQANEGDGECTQVFVLEQDKFVFSAAEIRSDIEMEEGQTARPVILEWAIGNETCDQVERRNASICTKNSACYNASNGAGYRCNCTEGYTGNPYTPGGCQDRDECKDPDDNPCVWKCRNTEGGFRCLCPPGSSGDGKKQGSGCKSTTPLAIGLGVGLGLLIILVIGGFWTYQGLKKRKIIRLKQENFLRNGGCLLEQHILSGGEVSATIFSIAELERATGGFSENQVIGRGGYGTVYRGILSDGSVVAIKKSKLMDEAQTEQFINEVIILSKINHENVVKLLGCCLESEVPMLVYEFMSNGTLFHHIHNSSSSFLMSWENRLRIATETEKALAYLHFKGSIPIIHRDIKSTNILLDENYIAKVSDFGASRLVPFDRTHVTTLVQGTLGYLDPEYFYTSQLTEKSDVYSFGVVLVELLTAEKPVSFCRLEMERNLASYFVALLEENRLLEVVDHKLKEEVDKRHLFAVAQLAQRCLSVEGEKRPSMKEVAVELGALRRLLMK